MGNRGIIGFLALVFFYLYAFQASSQCGGIMEPGFAFLSSSRGCAPFTVRIQTLYLDAVPGTEYFVNWGDGTPEETYVQVNPTGVILEHTYPNAPIDCGYDVLIDASNACNPRGSVVAIQTQVVVWTNDVISINPNVFRVCQGFAASLNFIDDSDWNCFPRATRENNEPRWIQWIYGTGPAVNRIPGVTVDGITGPYPYFDPAPNTNPKYPILAPGDVSLGIDVPVTTPADLGREFEVTLRNWNQCNPYDEDLTDLNPFNPVSGNIADGDNFPMVTTGRIVVVAAPDPAYQTRLGNAAGPLQTVFCVGENIFFQNLTPPIAGANFQYTWQFYDNDSGMGAPIQTSTATNPVFAFNNPGQKLIRLRVRDNNAAGNCEEIYESTVFISPTLLAQISVRDSNDDPVVPDFCQDNMQSIPLRFVDVSTGAANPNSRWRWEFYDENNVLVRQEPASGFSATVLGPFDEDYLNIGVYRVRLIIRDDVTTCESSDEVVIRIFPEPVAAFSSGPVCEGADASFLDESTYTSIQGEDISLREWDFDYDGVTFNPDPAYNNQTSFNKVFNTPGDFDVALRVSTAAGCSDMLVRTLSVYPIPLAEFVPDQNSGCNALQVFFQNTGHATQPDAIDRYEWEIDSGAGFILDTVQQASDPDFDTGLSKTFINTSGTDRVFRVRLRSVSVNACVALSAAQEITVLPGPASGFVEMNYSPFNDNCSPVSVDFRVDNATQALNPNDYTWRVSDANGIIEETSTGTNPEYTFEFVNNTQGIKDFFVRLRSTLPNACFGDSTRTIRVNPVPLANFVIDTLLFDCEEMQLRINALQAGVQYRWEVRENAAVVFADNNGAQQFNYTISRPLVGAADRPVTFTLSTVNFAGCESDEVQQTVDVPAREGVMAAFDATPVEQTFPDATVNISNQSSDGPWDYLWDFGDGNTSTDPNLSSYTYDDFGDYTISLSLSSVTCTSQASLSIRIHPAQPIVDFDYAPASGCAPLTVSFTNLSQFTDPSSYVWNFGQYQGMSNAVHPNYTYFEPGLYTVSLSASNSIGISATETKSLIIEVLPRPNAAFDIKPRIAYIPDTKLYTRNLSTGATSFTWDFGDGTIIEDFEPTHVYKSEGSFDVSLIARSPEGCVDTLKLEAAVQAIAGGRLLVPNAFSPSTFGPGDGTIGNPSDNDVFLPLMEGIAEFEMMIFNRWGEMLYHTTDKQRGWDGYHNGKLCPQDVYVYRINAILQDGQKIARVGDVNLIR